jgi:hypothetical protein
MSVGLGRTRGLSAEEQDAFIDQGYVYLPGAVPPRTRLDTGIETTYDNNRRSFRKACRR